MDCGWHYNIKFSLSSALFLSFSGMCFVLLFLYFVVFCRVLVFVLSLELCKCSSDLFLSNRPRTALTTMYITGYD